MERLSCRSCGAAIGSDGLDRRLAILVCSHCGAIFDLTRKQDRQPTGSASTRLSDRVGQPRPPAALPERFSVDRGDGRMTVRWSWNRTKGLWLLLFALAWNAFLVAWYATALGGPSPGGDLMTIVFPIGHVAAGVAITYAALAQLLNRSTVVVDDRKLVVRHRPIPWLPMPTVAVDDLEQLFVKRRVRHTKNGTKESFAVHAVTRDDRDKKLIVGLDELEQGLYLEQELEKRLQIRDRPVAGETIR